MGPKRAYVQTFRGLQNCSELPQKTLCCQETATAGEEKSSANLLPLEKACLESGAPPMGARNQEKCSQRSQSGVIVSPLGSATPLHNPASPNHRNV